MGIRGYRTLAWIFECFQIVWTNKLAIEKLSQAAWITRIAPSTFSIRYDEFNAWKLVYRSIALQSSQQRSDDLDLNVFWSVLCRTHILWYFRPKFKIFITSPPAWHYHVIPIVPYSHTPPFCRHVCDNLNIYGNRKLREKLARNDGSIWRAVLC